MDGQHQKPCWSGLPPELVEKVLLWLPLPCLLTYTLVCKQWMSLLSSPTFAQAWSSLPQRKPWFLLYFKTDLKNVCLAYDFESARWYRIPLGFLPFGFSTRIEGSSGGLLLVKMNDSPDRFSYVCNPRLGHSPDTFTYICNPLTKSWIELPKSNTSWLFAAKGFHVERNSSKFKVVQAGRASDGRLERRFRMVNRDSGRLATEIYDSETNSWKPACPPPSGRKFMCSEAMIICNGLLFCTKYPHPCGVGVYNEAQVMWKEVPTPIVDTSFKFSLAKCHDTLFVVGGWTKTDSSESCITIWMLDQDVSEWTEVEKMPQALHQQLLCKCNSVHKWFNCVGVGEMLCFHAYNCTDVLTYDLHSKLWSWLPSPPSMRGFPLVSEGSQLLHNMREFQHYVRGFEFEPNIVVHLPVASDPKKRVFCGSTLTLSL